MNLVQKCFWIGVVVVVVGLAVQYTAARDASLKAENDRYETCVRNQYGTTPQAWYSEHGTEPECPDVPTE